MSHLAAFSRGLIIICTFALGGGTLFAQSVWLDPTNEQGITVEILQPHVDEIDNNYFADNLSMESSVWFFSGRIALGSDIDILCELPVSHLKGSWYHRFYGDGWYDRIGDNEGSTIAGNPAVGIEHCRSGSWFYQQLGARFSLAEHTDDAGEIYGALADGNRFDAFSRDGYSLRARLGARIRTSSGLLYHLFVEPVYLHHTSTEYIFYYDYDYIQRFERFETVDDGYLNYGAQVWLNSEVARMGAGIVGRYWMDNEGAGFGSNSIHRFGFTAAFGSGSVRPSFHFQVPLDRDWSPVRFVYGLSLFVGLGGTS